MSKTAQNKTRQQETREANTRTQGFARTKRRHDEDKYKTQDKAKTKDKVLPAGIVLTSL